jgi:hypothetical protein
MQDSIKEWSHNPTLLGNKAFHKMIKNKGRLASLEILEIYKELYLGPKLEVQ